MGQGLRFKAHYSRATVAKRSVSATYIISHLFLADCECLHTIDRYKYMTSESASANRNRPSCVTPSCVETLRSSTFQSHSCHFSLSTFSTLTFRLLSSSKTMRNCAVSTVSLIYLVFFVTLLKEATGNLIIEGLSYHNSDRDDDHEDDQVCVTLEKFDNSCSGHVQSTNSFTALTKAGSPCVHTSRMKNNSAKDQYCTFQGGKALFHQTVYVHSTECKVNWEVEAISPMKLIYSGETCTYGYRLKSCTLGPCQEEHVETSLPSRKIRRIANPGKTWA